MCQWQQIGGNLPCDLEPSDSVIYMRDYVSGANFRESETNGHIFNFKKHPKYHGSPQWKYKAQAIRKCAAELSQLFKPGQPYTIAPMPTSKVPGDAEYDSRLVDTLSTLQKMRPNVVPIASPVAFKNSHKAQHLREKRLRADEIYDLLEWKGLPNGFSGWLNLFDDIITNGSHFKACQRLIHENTNNVHVQGIFWARTIWPDDFPEFEIDFISRSP